MANAYGMSFPAADDMFCLSVFILSFIIVPAILFITKNKYPSKKHQTILAIIGIIFSVILSFLIYLIY